MTEDNGTRATLRDVYEAVNNVRSELGDKIDKLADLVNTVAVSHEHRLTVVEQTQAIHDARITVLESDVKKNSSNIALVGEALREDEAATKALMDAATKRSGTRRWVIGTILTAIGLLTTIVYFFAVARS